MLLCLCLCMCPCGIKAVDQSVLATTVSNTTTSPPPLSSPSFDPEDVPSCSSDCGPTRAAHLNPLCLCVCGHSASIQNLTVCFKEEQNGMKRMLGTHTRTHTRTRTHTHTDQVTPSSQAPMTSECGRNLRPVSFQWRQWLWGILREIELLAVRHTWIATCPCGKHPANPMLGTVARIGCIRNSVS